MSLLIHHNEVTDAFDDLGMMLHDAVRDRNISGYRGIKMLMGLGPPINFLDDHNNTPLHRAVHMGYVAGVEALLRYNADIMAVDGEWGLSSEDLSLKVIDIEEGGKMYKDVAPADLIACYRLLEAASTLAYQQNDSDWDIQLRRDDRVEVHGLKLCDMHMAMNGTVGVLQEWVPDEDQPANGLWRLLFTDAPDRGPAFVHARHLRRV